MIRKFAFVTLILFLLAACNSTISTEKPPANTQPPVTTEPTQRPATEPINSQYLPQAGDASLSRGKVFIENSELQIMESDPVQVALVLKGYLPTPCNQLRVIANPPDEQNKIQVDAYSVIDSTQICAQVTEPIDVNIGLGSFPSGHYSIWVNGEMIGEFDS